MSGEINVVSRTQIINIEPSSSSVSIINAGPQGSGGPIGVPGTNGGGHAALVYPNGTASAAATNNGAGAFNAVSDPHIRNMINLLGFTKVRMQGRIGGSIHALTKIRLQYHIGENPAVANGDAGWTTLCTSAGAHTLSTMFYTAELAIPVGARINNCLIRPGIYDGDGTADPTITCCILNFYS